MLRQPAAIPQWCMLGVCISSSLNSRNWQVDFIVEKSKGRQRDGQTDISRNVGLKKESVTVFPVYPFRATPACLTFPPAMSNVPYTTLCSGCTALTQWTMRWQKFVCAHSQTLKRHSDSYNTMSTLYTHTVCHAYTDTHI